MNNEKTDKPNVIIDLEPILEAYLRWVFNTPFNQDEITVSRTKDLGKLIHSLILISDLPKKFEPVHKVVLHLPVNQVNHFPMNEHFLYVSSWGQQKIKDAVEFEFRSWVRTRFEIGYRKKMEQKDIVNAILRGINLRDNVANFDTIKKIDYRNRRSVDEKRFEELLISCE